MEMEHQQNAKMALEFLSRCRLEGREVPAYNTVVAWLYGMLDHPQTTTTATTLEELAEQAMNPEPHEKGD